MTLSRTTGISDHPGPRGSPSRFVLLAVAAVLAPVPSVVAVVAVVAAVVAPVAPAVHAVCDYHGTADGGNSPPATSGCKWHVGLLPRRRPRWRPAPLGWECARWRPAGPRRFNVILDDRRYLPSQLRAGKLDGPAEPVPPADRPDQRRVPLDERVPGSLVSGSRAGHQGSDRRASAHGVSGHPPGEPCGAVVVHFGASVSRCRLQAVGSGSSGAGLDGARAFSRSEIPRCASAAACSKALRFSCCSCRPGCPRVTW